MAKTDYAHYNTDKKLAEIEKRINTVFKEAQAEAAQKAQSYWDSYEAKYADMWQKYDSDQITYSEFMSWQQRATTTGKRYENLSDTLANKYADAYETALAYVNDATPEIYSLNRNYTAYTISGQGRSVSFNLWDESTVRRLAVKNPSLMPSYPKEKALARGINLAYSKKQITASITSSILQGKSVAQTATDLQNRLAGMNKTSALRAARTAITEAQNAGRMDALYAAKDMGIQVEKEWVATLDSRTRPTHGALDGVHVALSKKFSNGCDHPGDPKGPASEVYNCRCTIVAYLPKNQKNKTTTARWSKDAAGNKSTVYDTDYTAWAKKKLKTGQTVAKTGNAGTVLSKDGYPIFMDKNGNPASSTGKTYTNLRQNDSRAELREWESSYYSANSGLSFSRSEFPNSYTYTTEYYRTINGYLRGTKILSASEAKRVEKIAAGISKEMSRTTLNEDIVCRRGVGSIRRITGTGNSLDDAKAAVGTVYTDKGFTSTSALSTGGFGGMTLKITVPKEAPCVYVENFSMFKGGSETELLLDKDTSFLITGVEEDGYGGFALLMEVIV